MQTIMLPVDSIHVGKRQRSDDEATLKHILELTRDIQENGLIHAPLVDQNYELVAGFCRLSAIQRIAVEYYYAGAKVAPGFIPVTVTHMSDLRDIFRLELHENLRRKNLTPLDEAKAVSRLHKFLEESKGPSWTREQTGAELEQLRGETPKTTKARTEEVSDALLIAPFENDPEVQKATSRKAAVSIVKKKMEQRLMATLGEHLAASASSEHTVLEGSCLDILPTLGNEAFAGIICDPPYGIDADTFGEQTMKGGGHAYEDTKELAYAIAELTFKEGARVCGPDAHLYLFCDFRYFQDFSRLALLHGWRPFASPLIWHKPNLGHAPWPGFFARRYECILFAVRGARALQKSRSDIFEYPALVSKIHAAQKPVELIAELLSLSFFPGEKVLDVCAGSGTIFRAAQKVGMVATGIENDPEAIGYCKAAAAGE